MELSARNSGIKSDEQGIYIDPEDKMMLQKYDENLKLTKNLLHRIGILEQKMEKSGMSRIVTKVNNILRSLKFIPMSYLKIWHTFIIKKFHHFLILILILGRGMAIRMVYHQPK